MILLVEFETEDDEVALDAVELRHPRVEGPALEAETLEQLEARAVVAKGARGQDLEAEPRRAPYGFLEQAASDALAAVPFGDVDADLGGGAVGRSLTKRLEAKPAGDLPVRPRHPQRVPIWVVAA